uniref:Uncharacterized protein n=1 Tax=Parastrongyloides trichosuri TaxID=131310 RepID=A0A0N4ZCR6_PARTI
MSDIFSTIIWTDSTLEIIFVLILASLYFMTLANGVILLRLLEMTFVQSCGKVREEGRILKNLFQEKISMESQSYKAHEKKINDFLKCLINLKYKKFGTKTDYNFHIIFAPTFFFSIFPFGGEFNVTFSDGTVLPFLGTENFCITKAWKININTLAESNIYNEKLMKHHMNSLREFVENKMSPVSSLIVVCNFLNEINYENKEWNVLYFLFRFMLDNLWVKKKTCFFFLILQTILWVLFMTSSK